MSATAANPSSAESSHWYYPDGRACYEVENRSKGGMRPTTLADARKLGLIPSVTTILRVLHKQALVDWLCEQSCLAVLTTPRLEGEGLDSFVHRVLHTEHVQDQESQAARDRGTQMHDGLECLFSNRPVDPELLPWIEPAYRFLVEQSLCWLNIQVETIVCGNGYAGKVDWIGTNDQGLLVVDFKTTKKLPRSSWPEHRLQLAGYAAALHLQKTESIATANLYISTIEQGEFTFCPNPNWIDDWGYGFSSLLTYWQWANGYIPPPALSAETIKALHS